MVLGFLSWGVMNREKFTDVGDFKIVASRAVDLSTSFLFCLAFFVGSVRFLRKYEAPFIQIYLEERNIKLDSVRKVVLGVISSLMFKRMYNNLLN